jgi:Leucine-rich repeat (LRR) protein
MLALSALDLGGNHITHVGAMPPNITGLELYDNRITAISAAVIASMLRCVYLHLQYNRLRSLPTTLGLLTNIGELQLKGNELTELPAEIGRLALSGKHLYIEVRFTEWRRR